MANYSTFLSVLDTTCQL
jgi:two-component system, response regulator YesN